MVLVEVLQCQSTAEESDRGRDHGDRLFDCNGRSLSSIKSSQIYSETQVKERQLGAEP